MLCTRWGYLMPKNALKFKASLKKFGQQTRDNAEIIFKKIAFDLDQAVVLDTPVDTGRARGNWYPTINAPSKELTNDKKRYSKTGGAVVGKINETINTAQLGDTVWLTNNLPYINRLEDGYSQKAPEGMVGINLLRVQAKFGGVINR